MNIISVKWANAEQSLLLVNDKYSVPWPCHTWHRELIQEWMDAGNTPDAYAPPPEPTLDEVYDDVIRNQRVLKALVLALNDGTITPGANMTPQQLKQAIKSKM